MTDDPEGAAKQGRKGPKSLLYIVLAVAFVAIAALFIITSPLNFQPQQKLEPSQRDFFGKVYNFRADLSEAEKVIVLPDESEIPNLLFSQYIRKIRIAYIPNETENPYYLADAYELAFKLTLVNNYFYGATIPVENFPVNSTAEASAAASVFEPIILLLGPSTTSETAVKVSEGGLIVAHGRDLSEAGRTYTDLDLSVDKIILVMMEAVESYYYSSQQ